MNVQAGDLILFRVSSSANWLDKAIGWGQKVIHEAPTKDEYCHVAVAGPTPDRMYEAVWPKFHNTPFDPTKINKNLLIEIYRVNNATPDEVAKVMKYCDGLIGEWYPVFSIATFGLLTIGHAPYCSQAAWRAWMDAKRVLCDDERMVSPDDIAASTELTRVS